jgi:glycerophosphoryl diester phosphodiesterase
MLGALGGLGLLAACSRSADPSTPGSSASGASRKATRSGPVTVRSWAAERGTPFYIAHRGAGDVYPEHSMPSYRAAVEMGAQCLEVSVNMTSDGVLVCLHDLTYDRTTTGKGLVAKQPSSVLSTIGVRQPQLGPAWVQSPLPAVPRLETVLTEFGGKVVICLEAKDDRAYPAMMAMVTRMKLLESVIVKAGSLRPRGPACRSSPT